jgi:putative DNA primase/helicase
MNHHKLRADFLGAIHSALGYSPPEIEPGTLQRFSSNGRRSDTSGWCRLFLDGRAGVFGDFRSGFSSLWSVKDEKPPTLAQRQQRSEQMRQARAEAAAAQAIQWSRAASRNATIWAEAVPLSADDPVARYLAGRGIQLPSCTQALRYHPALDYWHMGRCIGRFPAMLGAVTDPSGTMVGLHRTYLTQDGRKADVEIAKKLTGASALLAGCSIKLDYPTNVMGALTIGVAEGIETALACSAASGTPTVSAISAGGLERYQWPAGLQSLIVFADHDASQVGQKAAAALARRARSRGLTSRVLTPPIVGTDWADVWATQMEGS